MRITFVATLSMLLALASAGCDDSRPSGGDGGRPDAGVSDAGSRDAGRDAGAPDAGPPDAGPPDAGWPPGTTCTPGYACPAGATFRIQGSVGRCLFEELDLPAGAEPYCFYFDDGYFGITWPLGGSPGYACPPSSRRAPSSVNDYCLWEDLETPAGATADCGELASGRIGFRWPCP